MSELRELVHAALGAAADGEQVEAYAEEERRTEVERAPRRGGGHDLRGVARGRRAGDPRRAARLRVGRRSHRGRGRAQPWRPREPTPRSPSPMCPMCCPTPPRSSRCPSSSARRAQSITADEKVRMALDLERYTVARDPRVTKVDLAQVGDEVSRVAIASTTGVDQSYERTDAWVRRGHPGGRGRRDPDGVLLHDRTRARPARVGADRRRGGRSRGADARRRQAGDREAAGDPRPLRRIELPRRAGGRAERRQRVEGSLAVRRHGRSGGGCPGVHADRRRTPCRRTGRVSVRRRGRAERPDRAVHRRRAQRVPALHLYGAPRGRRSALDRQREARRIQERARRRHVELLRRAGRRDRSTRSWPRRAAACSSWT